MIERKQCEICGHDKLKLFEVYPRWHNLEIVKCKNCGYVFTRQIPDAEEYKKLYENFHQIELSPTSDLKRFDAAKFAQKKKSYQQIMRSVKKFALPEAANILEIGCYLGGFLDYARQLGFTTFGCEINPYYVDYVTEKGHTCYWGEIDQLHLRKNFFDVVVLQEVLEHLPRPVEFLTFITDILRPGGLIVVEIPNMSFHYWKGKLEKNIVSKIFPHHPVSGLIPRYHLNHFSVRSLKNLFRKTGGEIEQIQIRRSKAVAEKHSNPAILLLLFWNYIASCIYAVSSLPIGNALIVTSRVTQEKKKEKRILHKEP